MNLEELYRSVGTGKYLFREDKAINLPKLMARGSPYTSEAPLPNFFFTGSRIVKGNTITEMHTKIDEAINSYPQQHRKHFSA